ncbi:MAG: hypothetical protein AAB262_08125 [Elusimicrobiota bacterium]
MKWILAAMTVVVPGVVWAFAQGAPMAGGMMHHGGCAMGHFSAVLMAGVAVLGYWVLRLPPTDSGYEHRAGKVVGWVLIFGGLVGFLCASLSHMRKASGQCCASGGMMQMPAGHPAIDGMSKPAEAPITKPSSKKKGK